MNFINLQAQVFHLLIYLILLKPRVNQYSTLTKLDKIFYINEGHTRRVDKTSALLMMHDVIDSRLSTYKCMYQYQSGDNESSCVTNKILHDNT